MPRKIVADFEAIKTKPFLSVCSLEDDALTLFFENGQSFTVTLCDYPVGTSFWYCEQTQANGTVEGNLEKIYAELLKESGAEKATIGSDASKNDDDDDNDGSDDMGKKQGTTTTESGESSMMGQQTGSFGMDYYADSVDYGGNQQALPAEFLKDIERAEKCGYKVSYERIADAVRLNLQFYLKDLVSDSTAMAWGFSRAIPFNIRFTFERPEYLRCEKRPELVVTQDGKPCRFGQQILSFLELYLKNHWTRNGWVPPKPLFTISDIAASANEVDQATAKPGTTGTHNLDKLLNLLTPPQKLIYDKLLKMGFAEKLAAPAARQSSTVEDAVDRCTNGTVLAEDTTVVEAKGWFDNLKEKAGMSSSSANNNSNNSNKLSEAEIQLMQESDPSWVDDPNKYVQYNSETDGWLVHLVKYIRKRTPLCHQYCCICDQKHLLGASMLKVAVCERELCTFRFQEMGIGKDATDSVATGGGVIDLLVAFFRCAVSSPRRDLILEPYPQLADPQTKKLVFDPKNKDFKKLEALTKQLPETRELVGVENIDHLSAKLVNKDPYLLPLLEWIISSNRSLIVKLRNDQQLKKMATPHQFLLVSASPDKQAKFDALKEKYGSFFAYHGSGSENWHCIFRAGLRNHSNKPGLMTAGAALGAGVYCAVDAATSMGYSRAHGLGTGAKITRNGQTESYFDGSQAGSFACMAIIEVAKDPSGYKDHGNVKTIQNEDAICTRFFFVFTSQDQVTKAQGCNCSGDFEKELRNLVAAT